MTQPSPGQKIAHATYGQDEVMRFMDLLYALADRDDKLSAPELAVNLWSFGREGTNLLTSYQVDPDAALNDVLLGYTRMLGFLELYDGAAYLTEVKAMAASMRRALEDARFKAAIAAVLREFMTWLEKPENRDAQ
jgi:hypothetical protein